MMRGMKFQFSLATILICTAVLAMVSCTATKAWVYETIPITPTSPFSPSTFDNVRKPTNSEIALRIVWAAPLAIAATLLVLWIARNPPHFDYVAIRRKAGLNLRQFGLRFLFFAIAQIAILLCLWRWQAVLGTGGAAVAYYFAGIAACLLALKLLVVGPARK
jgi:hypothetical protein